MKDIEEIEDFKKRNVSKMMGNIGTAMLKIESAQTSFEFGELFNEEEQKKVKEAYDILSEVYDIEVEEIE